jgi:hypothetical protein
MKTCTIVKIGYTAGIYGCSDEYFSCFYTKKGEIKSFIFSGMYGVEDRVSHAMQAKGYKVTYCVQMYGKLTRSDIIKKQVNAEYSILKGDKLIIKL